jgi:hypothetical protein
MAPIGFMEVSFSFAIFRFACMLNGSEFQQIKKLAIESVAENSSSRVAICKRLRLFRKLPDSHHRMINLYFKFTPF